MNRLLKGVDTACIVVQKRVPVSVILTLSLIFFGFRHELSTYYHSKSHFFQDKLILADSVTSVYELSPSIGCAMIGMVPDSKFQVLPIWIVSIRSSNAVSRKLLNPEF